MSKATRAPNYPPLIHAKCINANVSPGSKHLSHGICWIGIGKGFVGELEGRRGSLRRVFNFICDLLTHLLFGNREVIARLQIHPKLRAIAKVA